MQLGNPRLREMQDLADFLECQLIIIIKRDDDAFLLGQPVNSRRQRLFDLRRFKLRARATVFCSLFPAARQLIIERNECCCTEFTEHHAVLFLTDAHALANLLVGCLSAQFARKLG